MNEIIGQILGFVATVITVVSYQANDKKKLLIIQSVATLSTCLGYLFLGVFSGFVLNIVCLIRNGAFFFLKKESHLYRIAAIVLFVLIVVAGLLSWQGWMSVLILVALALNTLFMAFGSPQILRYSVLFTSSLILTFNVFVFMLGGILNEGLSIVSSFIGILRFRRVRATEK